MRKLIVVMALGVVPAAYAGFLDSLKSSLEMKIDDIQERSRARAGTDAACAETPCASEPAAAAEAVRQAVPKYDDGSELPPCVADVAAYIRGPFRKAVAAVNASYAESHDFRNVTAYDPWGGMVDYMGSERADYAFRCWVLREGNAKYEWKDPPITTNPEGRRFSVVTDEGNCCGTFYVRKDGMELVAECQELMSRMKGVVKRMETAQKAFEKSNEKYAEVSARVHDGMDFTPYRTLSFGDTPYTAYTKLKPPVEMEVELNDRAVPALPWREICGLALGHHKLEMGFSKFADDDAPGLTYLRLTFVKALPSIADLKRKYEALGFVFESEKECIGHVWRDPGRIAPDVAVLYQEAMITLMGASVGGVSAKESEHARKTLADIKAKHMEPVYRERAVGTCKGYSIEMATKCESIRDGVPEGNCDPDAVSDVVFWDKAITDLQMEEYRKFKAQAQAEKENAAAAKATRERAAALDF